MDVKIIETGEVVKLSIVDDNGIDWAADLIGNAGALVADDDGQAIMSRLDYEWWAQYIADYETTQDEAAQLAEDLGVRKSSVLDYIGKYTDGDYESHRRQARNAMQAMREEMAVE